jgi:flagellar motor switch protein FliN
MSEARGDTSEAVRGLLSGLAGNLAQVLESMTDRRPETAWEPVVCTLADIEASPGAEMLWWQQKFQILSEPALWVGAPRGAWEDLGGRTLRAAGLEEIDAADARNTWLEILNQALAATARVAGESLGEEVNCGEGSENAPLPDSDRWHRIVVTYEQPLPPVWVRLSAALIERLERVAQSADSAVDPQAPGGGPADHPLSAAHPARTMELLLDVELPVSLSFGRTQVPLKDVLKLTTGSIVELNRGVAEPVDVLVNQCLIARGEVVVIDGNYAVRIQQIASPQERLRSLR